MNQDKYYVNFASVSTNYDYKKERHKYKTIEGSQRTWNFYSHNDIEDEFHFLINCQLYNNPRELLFAQGHEQCQNFNNLDCKSTF